MALAPGVKLNEKDVLNTVAGVDVDVTAVIGTAQRGPDDMLRLVLSFDDYETKYGGYYNNSYMAYTVRAFFEQGGSALWCGRVVGAGAAKASGAIDAIGTLVPGTPPAETVDLAGKYFGEYGDRVVVSTQKAETTNNGALVGNEDQITFGSVAQFEIGDCCILSDGTNQHVFLITGVNTATKVVDITPANPAANAIADASPIKTASTHRMQTKTSSAVVVTGTTAQFTVVNSVNLRIGDLLFITSGSLNSGTYAFVEVRITSINGSVIQGDVLNETYGTITEAPTDSVVLTQNFNLNVQFEGRTETFVHLSLEDEDELSYVDDLMSGERNVSELISATDAGNVEVLAWRAFYYPMPVDAGMTGGLDGAAPVDNDYLGTNVAKAYKHGIKMMDDVPQVSTFAVPGVTTTAVIIGATEYSEANDQVFVGDCPLAADTFDELMTFRNLDIALDNSFGTLYGPWHKELSPLIPDLKVILPPSVRNLGVYSAVAAERGVHKAPANEQLFNVVELVAEFSEQERALLNEAGINVIRSFTGRGVRAFGARTLYRGTDGKQFIPIRRVANYVKDSISVIAADFNFDPINETLYTELSVAIEKFLRGLWEAGMLYPQEDPTEAFTVIINKATNPDSVILSGKVMGKVAFQPPPPAEVIELDIALWQGNSSITEG